MSAPFRVLIIDDSEQDTQLIARVLRKQWRGLVFEQVCDATAVHKVLSEQAWDCVLCDIVIPGFSAPEALKIVKQSAHPLPFILISGAIKIENTINLLKSGAHNFVGKDDLARLVPAIESAIREVEIHRCQEEAEEKLHRCAQITAHTTDMQVLLDRNYVFLTANDAYLKAYNKSEDEVIGQSAPIGAGREYFESSFKPYAERCLAGETVRHQQWLEFPATGRACIDITYSPYLGTDNKVQGFVVTGHDITEFKRAETALKMTQFAVDNFANPIFWINEDARFIYVNDAACQSLGYNRDELLSMMVSEIHPDFSAESWPQHWQEMKEKGSLTFESRHQMQSGKIFPVEIHTSFIKYENEEYNWVYVRDISEHKQAEEQLNRYAQITASTPDMQALLDLNYVYLAANEAYLQTFIKSADELIGHSIVEVFGEEFFTRVIKPNVERCLTGEKVRYQDWFDFPATGRIYMDISYSPYLGPDGQPRGFVVTGHDITQLKQTKMKLHALSERLQTSIEQMPFAYILWDKDFLVTEWNPAAEQIFGFSRDEMLGKNAVDYCVPEPARAAVHAVIKRLLAGETTDYSESGNNVRKDGTVISCVWHNTPLKDATGSTIAVLSMVVDTTERERMEGERRKLAQAVEQSPDSIVITSLDAEIEYVNETFLQNTGYNREEVIGKNPRFKQSGKTPRKTYKDMWARLTAGQSWTGELFNRRKDGTDYIEQAFIAPLKQPDGTITHYIAAQKDITSRKKLTAELDEHRHHLTRLVEERTAELAVAQKKAESANQAKSTFLANMSHEIRTPMNAIIGLTHLMQKAGATPKQTTSLNKIDSSARHLLSIINNILDISKIEAGKLFLEHVDFDLDALFDNIQSLFTQQISAKGLTIECDLGDVPHWLQGDPTRLRQALINYVGNALKFTEKGGITLRAVLKEENIDNILVRFEVQDTGIGIKPDKLTELFVPFSQADASTTRKHGGTGLGLVITQRLAELMEGDTGVESQPGKGSTFWFTARLGRGQGVLPVAPSGEVLDAETELRERHAGARVLLVEDNAINCEVALAILDGVKLAVDTAQNGREAVTMVQNNNYDLILMDIQMPVMDGLEATRMIRSMKGALANKAKIPILAMTANVFSEDRQACMKAGMVDFVAKPIELEDLFKMIAKHLPRKK